MGCWGIVFGRHHSYPRKCTLRPLCFPPSFCWYSRAALSLVLITLCLSRVQCHSNSWYIARAGVHTCCLLWSLISWTHHCLKILLQFVKKPQAKSAEPAQRQARPSDKLTEWSWIDHTGGFLAGELWHPSWPSYLRISEFQFSQM